MREKVGSRARSAETAVFHSSKTVTDDKRAEVVLWVIAIEHCRNCSILVLGANSTSRRAYHSLHPLDKSDLVIWGGSIKPGRDRAGYGILHCGLATSTEALS